MTEENADPVCETESIRVIKFDDVANNLSAFFTGGQPVVQRIFRLLRAQFFGLRGKGFAWAADLTDEASINALVAEVGSRWGSADVLVNNAGIYPSGFLLDISTQEFDEIFAINLRAPYILTKGV
ncbi:MAG: SDR family NAD(P)-dependent oxidoreductase, partial [Verrucomicrobiaceae bacterium]